MSPKKDTQNPIRQVPPSDDVALNIIFYIAPLEMGVRGQGEGYQTIKAILSH